MEQLTSPQEADARIDADQPTWLLKHSTACPISHGALAEFERYVADHPDEPAAIVVIQRHRPVSHHVAERLGVRHESPQLFLVQNGAALWHASHGGITATAMARNRERVVSDGG